MDALGMPPSGLTGKVAIVTGVSRPKSIGAAICRIFASCDVDVFFTHWLAYDQRLGYEADEERLAALEEELRVHGVRVASAEVNLGLPDAPRRVMESVVEQLGVPTILVNNAAHWSGGGIETIDATVLDAHHAVNVRGMALLCAEFVRRYPGGPGGRIINLSSGQGVAPMPQELAYATSKGAVEAFTVSLAAEVAARGITVNAVDPGGTDTGWMTDEIRAEIICEMGMGRVGQPEDAARLIAFLASDAGEWITGQVIHSRGASVR
ncbi:MAG: SDR family oxidoreductase [Dehalococcoidia bacterium]